MWKLHHQHVNHIAQYQDQDYIVESTPVYARLLSFFSCLADQSSFDQNAIRAILFTYLKSDKRNLELLLTFQLLCLLPSKAIDVQILLLEKIR